MRTVPEKKVTEAELIEAYHANGCAGETFAAYCRLHESCDSCNRRIRFLCGLKDSLETLQVKIIKRICRGR